MKTRLTGILLSFVLLMSFISCTSEESRQNTQSFLAGLQTTASSSMNAEAVNVLNDLSGKNPPGDTIITNVSSPQAFVNVHGGPKQDPYGLDSLYGTWEYDDTLYEWIYADSLPDDGIKYMWEYYDSVMTLHDAYVLLDEFGFYDDSLLSNLHVSVGIDNEELAWMEFSANYLDPVTISSLSYTFEINDYFQYGAEITSATSISGDDPEDFAGEVHLWVIDYTSNNYRIDLTVTLAQNGSGNIVLEDSDEWKLDVDVSEVVETDSQPGDTVMYEKRNIEGEITHSGNDAATISGYFWEPEDAEHPTVITITYPDGFSEPLTTYIPSEGEFIELKPW